MKSGETAKKAAYIGAGAGLALFAIIGLLPGSLIGGSIGVAIAGKLFGAPLTPHLLPRLTVALSMLLGVFVSGVLFVAGGTTAGWTIGNALDALKTSKPARAYFTGNKKTKKAAADDDLENNGQNNRM